MAFKWEYSPSRITMARESRGMTKSDLASKINGTVNQISDWECGKVLPGVRLLEKIANALQIPPKFFYIQAGDYDNQREEKKAA